MVRRDVRGRPMQSFRQLKSSLTLILVVSIGPLLFACDNPAPQAEKEPAVRKIGVLLVNHGSRRKAWRDMLVDVERAIDDRLLALPNVVAVKTAFNEYTEPSVATQMKWFDDEGFDEVIVLPLFLTVGGHVNLDIPNLIGIKNDRDVLEELPKHGVPVYRPRVRVTLLQTMDATDFLQKNILRRTQSLLGDRDGSSVGVTLATYGDTKFNQQWEELMAELGVYLQQQLGIDVVNWAWSGHLVNYSLEPTKKAINQVLAEKEKNILISVYVAYDSMFQSDIIGGAARDSDRPEDVLYSEKEAVLPDENLNDWIVQSVADSVSTGGLTELSFAD